MSTPVTQLETQSSDEALPEGWILCESKSLPGRKYYFDRRSGSSLWTKPPPGPEKTSKTKQRKCKKHKDHTSPRKFDDREERKQNLKRKNDSSDRGNVSQKRSRQDEEQADSPSPSCSSSGAAGTPKTYSYDTQRKGHEFLSPPADSHGREAHKISPSDRSRAGPNKEFKANIPNKSKLSPISADQTTNNTTSFQSDGFDQTDIKYSPSQFFEANKLICSLQAQLVDERGAEVNRRKDMFASIEEGITSHNIEYSSKNHPATPPHFRQANEIVSTIKSRLNENISVSEKKPRFSTSANDRLAVLRCSLSQSTKETPKLNNSGPSEQKPVLFENKSNIMPHKSVGEHASANDRLAALRHSLSQCVKESPEINQLGPEQKSVLFENRTNMMPHKSVIEHIQAPLPQRPVLSYVQKSNEAMEIGAVNHMRCNPASTYSTTAASTDSHPADNLVLVVDTNIFIHDIQFLKLVLDSYITGYKDKPTLMVPWQVINELDKMKDNNNGNKFVCSKARIATDYLYQVLPNSNRIKGQTLRDSSNHIYPCELPDDEILNCCLQQSQRGNAVILLSNDKNLCTRACINSIRAMGVREMKDLLREETEHCGDNDVRQLLKYYESCIYQLLANVLENEMRARYNNLWQHVLFKAPPWSLMDVLQCLIKHWIAVFSGVFPRIEPLIQRVKTALSKMYDKGSARITSSEVANFKELAFELASKFQIIPEYMELAKLTMERLNSDQNNRNLTSLSPAPEDDEKLLIDAFENVWTVFSSYCAKLASMLGVTHQLEDRMDTSESPDIIRNKWSDYSNHIQSLAYALKRTLTANENSGIEPLHTTLLECLALIGSNGSSIDNDSLRIFCLNNRHMIHEALVKFTQLTELLGRCQSSISN